MRTKRNFIALCFAAFAIASGYCSMKTYQSYSKELNTLSMQNVEALADGGEISLPNITLYYQNIHIPCYENVKYGETTVTRATGQYSATCYIDTTSTKGYHSHECSSCTSY